MISETISHYRILNKLSAGGMGEVYLAEDILLGRKVAVKVLQPQSSGNERARKRLVKEAQAAAALDHPNICPIHEVLEVDGQNFIIMQYVEGETLDSRIEAGSLGWRETLAIAVQIASALGEAHTHGIIHRDIKPQNIMLTVRGQVKVLDFGLAKAVYEMQHAASDAKTQSMLTDPGVIVGTAPYMSPEQTRAEPLDVRSDIFSFGTVIYEMLSGLHPFKSVSAGATIAAILTRDPVPLSNQLTDVPAEFERIIRKCLEKDRERRYQSARELLGDLENFQQGVVSGSAKHQTADLPKPVKLLRYAVAALAVIMLALAGYGGYLFFFGGHDKPPLPQANIVSVAVLPFVNVGSSADLEYLSDGITDNLINSLSQLPHLKVIAGNSVFRYKGQQIDTQAVGQELNVQALLMGRVSFQGDRLMISAELVDARDNAHLWGEQYNRYSSDILALQEELARVITEKLRLRLSGAEQQRLAKHYTDNTEAYQLYLKGRYFWNKRTPDDLKRSIGYFTQALDLDPKYALAYVGLSDAYAVLGASGYDVMTAKEAMSKAESAALNALAIDNSLAEAHTSLAFVKIQYNWDWAGAEKELNQALDLNPNYAPAHHLYSLYYTFTKRFDDAFAEGRKAQELDPLSLATSNNMSRLLIITRQYDKAIEQSRKTIEMDANYWLGYHYLGLAYEQKGAYKEAIKAFQKVIEVSGERPTTLASLGHAYALAGDTGEARAVLDKLKERAGQEYVSPFDIASIYAAMGENDQAFAFLDKAYEERSSALPSLNIDPTFAKLRSDPRFAAAVRRVGLNP